MDTVRGRGEGVGRVRRWMWVVGIVLMAIAPGAWARDVDGRLGVGLRAGGSFLSQDVDPGVEGNGGPMAGLHVFYGASNTRLLGVSIEWEGHQIEQMDLACNGCDLGNAVVVSVLPTAHFRNLDLGNFVPYLSLGLGVNVNRFNESVRFSESCPGCTITPKHTVALKIGGGADYFVTPNLALNGEWGWKVNAGETKSDLRQVGRDRLTLRDYRLNTFSFLFGFRYFY